MMMQTVNHYFTNTIELALEHLKNQEKLPYTLEARLQTTQQFISGLVNYQHYFHSKIWLEAKNKKDDSQTVMIKHILLELKTNHQCLIALKKMQSLAISFLEKQVQQTGIKLKLFNYKILGSIPLRLKNLENWVAHFSLEDCQMTLGKAALSIHQDLRAFIHQLGCQGSDLLEDLSDQLENVVRIDHLLRSDQIENVVKAIVAKIRILKPGASFIIPGGYVKRRSKGGHAVLYRIQKQMDDTYLFGIINTGESSYLVDEEARVLLAKKELKKQLQTKEEQKSFATTIREFKRSVRRAELQYTCLTKNHLSIHFFSELLNFQIQGTDKMRVVNAYIHKQLYQPHHLQVGRSYLRQKKGDCTVRPILKWLHTELGDIFIQFKAFITQRALEDLNSISFTSIYEGQIDDFTLKNADLISFMKQKGYELLQKRCAKKQVLKD